MVATSRFFSDEFDDIVEVCVHHGGDLERKNATNIKELCSSLYDLFHSKSTKNRSSGVRAYEIRS